MAAAKNSNDQISAPAPTTRRSSDQGDPNTSWTIQSDTPFQVTASVPGQVFTVGQLPDPVVQTAAGLDPAIHNAGLVVVTDAEAKAHPGGPEPTDSVLLASTPSVYPGTDNAGTVAVAGDPAAPALVSTVAQVPPTA